MGKRAVCYPDPEDTFSDEAVCKALNAVGLSRFLDEAVVSAGKGEVEEGAGRNAMAVETSRWPDAQVALYGDSGDRIMSAGESQRLELAHVLLARPRWCFL